MSIFPKRVKKGNTIVFHLALVRPLKKPVVADVNLLLFGPNGTRIEISQEQCLLFPLNQLNTDHENEYFNHPALLVANYIRDNLNNAYNATKLDGVLRRFTTHKHNYYPLIIDERFLPGKYHLELECYINGKRLGSLTKDNDYFYVDELKATYISNENSEDYHIFSIENNSPETTPFRIISYDASNGLKETYHRLAPLQRMQWKTKTDTSFVAYASDNGIIALHDKATASFYARNQKMKWVKNNGSMYLLHSTKEDVGYEIKGNVMAAWEQLATTKPEQVIIDKADKPAFELLKNMELIQKLNF